MVILNALPTEATPKTISEQEEMTLEDQLDAAMEQPVAEGLVVVAPLEDTPPLTVFEAVDEGPAEELTEEPAKAKEDRPTVLPSDPTEPPTHEEQIECATKGVADAALNQAKAQKATKLAKKEFDYSVEYLQDLVDKGPEVYPLFDGQKSDQGETEVVEYVPPLEKGQVRVRVIEMAVAPGEVGETPAPGSFLICHYDSDGLLYWTDSNNSKEWCGSSDYFTEDDRYEVLEDWPDHTLGSFLHVPPIQFGPPDESPAADPDHDPDAWRAVPIAEALVGLAPGRLTALHGEAVTMGDLEDFRAKIALGQAKWPKGIGPKAVTIIEEKILDWLGVNQ